jgi:hypothetical protein
MVGNKYAYGLNNSPKIPLTPTGIPGIDVFRFLNDRLKGAIAQLGERLTGSQEVVGSIPTSSTNHKEFPISSGSYHKKPFLSTILYTQVEEIKMGFSALYTPEYPQQTATGLFH